MHLEPPFVLGRFGQPLQFWQFNSMIGHPQKERELSSFSLSSSITTGLDPGCFEDAACPARTSPNRSTGLKLAGASIVEPKNPILPLGDRIRCTTIDLLGSCEMLKRMAFVGRFPVPSAHHEPQAA